MNTLENTKNSKIKKVKEILPLLWSSYEHMFEARETTIKNSINFLLIIVTFLPILCLTLYFHYNNILFLIPIFFQIVVLLILLKSFFIKGKTLPWFEFKETLSELDDNSFDVNLFAMLKTAENSTYKHMKALSPIVNRAVSLLIFSIFLILLACFFTFLKGSVTLYVVTVLLIIVFILLYFHYKDVPKFDFKNEYEEYKRNIDKWLKNENMEK